MGIGEELQKDEDGWKTTAQRWYGKAADRLTRIQELEKMIEEIKGFYIRNHTPCNHCNNGHALNSIAALCGVDVKNGA